MKHLLPLCAALPLLSGCVVAAGVAAGYVVSQQVTDNVHMAEVAFDVDKVWPSVKETMGILQEPGSEPGFQDVPRTVSARVDGAKVKVEVEVLDLDRTIIKVTAEKYLSHDNGTAADVLNQILTRLSKS